MNSIVASDSIPSIPASRNWPLLFVLVAILTALADWLFFRQVVGISLPRFMLALGAAVILANGIETSRRELLLYAGILVVALLPSVEDFNVLSAVIAVFGIGIFTLGVTAALQGDVKEKAVAVGWYLASAPCQFFRDVPVVRDWARVHGVSVDLRAMKGWVVPLALGSIFVVLFAAANPLIANWLMQWDLGGNFRQLDLQRLLFWLGTIVAVWAFVCVRRRFALPVGEPGAAEEFPELPCVSTIFNDAVVMRSLVLFNLLFAVQSAMDIHYLWRGAALPDGMSYASYAHRGAYPLILTALLAAAFVIVAMRPGSDAECSPPLRTLVLLWVMQNVLLVMSSILRLDLYVETYLLTYWRVAAFIWMLVVAIGLVLIIVRIVDYRSNGWLISANLVVLALTIYFCSVVNFAGLIACYNVSHSQDAAGAGAPIDLDYLISLGPQAIPVLDRYLAAAPKPGLTKPALVYFKVRRDRLALMHRQTTEGWRAWTFRGWRLTRYLEAHQP